MLSTSTFSSSIYCFMKIHQGNKQSNHYSDECRVEPTARSLSSVVFWEVMASDEAHCGSQEFGEDLTWSRDGEDLNASPQPWQDPSSPEVPFSICNSTLRHFIDYCFFIN